MTNPATRTSQPVTAAADTTPLRSSAHPRAPIRTLQILELVAEAGEAISLVTISQRLSIPKTSTLSLLRPMVVLGYLNQQDGRYGLGAMSYRLMLLANLTPTSRTLRPALEKLCIDVGESTGLCVLDVDQKHIEYVDACETQRPVRYVVRVGERRPLYSVSAGLVFLASKSNDWIATYADSVAMKRFTGATMTSREQLMVRVEQVRRDGYAVGAGEHHEEVFGFAAPILSHGNSVVAVISIGAPASRAFSSKEAYVTKLVAATTELSAQFGHRPA